MQHTKSGIVASAVMVLLVMAVRVKGGSTGGTPEERQAALSVSKMSKAPVIDGKIDGAEWREVVAIHARGS